MNTSDEILTPDDLKNNYTFIRLLGEGANGKTWLATRNKDNLKVAIKVMKFALSENFKSYELFCREAEVMKSLNVTGVPKVFECQAGDNYSLSYIVQEYIPYPSLLSILKERKTFDEKLTILILEKLANIIYQLQTNYAPPVIHRDIKPSNVLCDLSGDEPVVTLIDFGAVANPQKRSEKSTVAGTFGYMAPEQMLNDVVIQSDYYALGALATHLLTGIEPYEMNSQDNAFELDYFGAIKSYAPNTSQPVITLLGHLLNPTASQRPVNALALLDEIHRVKNGEMPFPDSNLKKSKSFLHYLSAILNRILPRPKQVEIPYRTWSKWPMIEGNIQLNTTSDSHFDHIDYITYTFDVNDRTWLGSCVLQNNLIHAKLKTLKLPAPCTVQYQPDNPRFNHLVKIGELDIYLISSFSS